MKVHTRRRRAGFTLTELLVVIGIMAVLMAVAVPSIFHYQRELKLTELDDNARAIFVAAQNHLTALRSASSGELKVSEAVGRPAREGIKAGEAQLLYVSTDMAGAEPGWLVLPGSIESDLAQGRYLVEFEPVSGAVYGVFFLERGSSQTLSESGYNAICAADCRTRAGRKDYLRDAGVYLGYYGADGALDVTRPDIQTLPKPKLKLINAEELRLEIEPDQPITSGKVYASVSVSDGANTKTLIKEGAITGKVAVVLDSLKSYSNRNELQSTWADVGGSFAQWVGDGSGGYVITPGADITVTVSLFYKPAAGESVAALPQIGSVTTNSLFAARSGNKVEVAYGRHLQNLGREGLDSTVTAAVQTREIDFDQAGGGIYSWEDTYGHDLRPFVPITNPSLERYSGKGLAIRDLNAVKAGSERYEDAGLFGVFSGSALEDVVLVDAKATGTNAGTLAGTLRGAGSVSVTGCQSYLTGSGTLARVRGSACAGGLVGLVENGTVQSGSFAATVISGTTVGGLVGQGNTLSIQNSYAAGHLSGSSVGGLVGRGSGIRMENCYAAGTIVRATVAAGGLSAGAASAQSAYAAVDYVEKPGAGATYYGAVASGSRGKVHYLVKSGFNDAQTVANVTPVTNPEKMETPGDLGLSTQAFTRGTNTVTYPYNLSNQADGSAREPRLSAPYPYPALRMEKNGAEAPVSHYGDWLEGSALRGIVAYYEQYRVGSELKTDFFYYALNDDGVLETKGALNATGSLYSDGYAFLSLNQLHEEGQSTVPMKVAIGTGAEMKEYSTLYLGTYVDGPVTYYAYGLPNSALDAAVAAADYFLQLRVAGLDSSAELSSLWLNPHFGRTAYNGYGDTNPSKASGAAKVPVPDGTGDVISIRSVRQFNNMRKYPSDIKSWTQELDLDAAVYGGHQEVDAEGYLTLGGLRVTTRQGDGTWTPVKGSTLPSEHRLAMPPIAMNYGRDTFGGTYDGKGHTIRALSITSRDGGSAERYAALFYRLAGSATLRDIRLTGCDVTGVSGGGADKNYVGALAGYTEGTILGCSVENTSIHTPQTGNQAGGFVGGLVGYIRKGAVGSADAPCQVVNCVVDGGGASYVGGFAGGIGEGTVQNAGVRVEGTDLDGLYKSQTVTGTDRVGGFAGVVGHDKRKGTLQQCYAAVKVSGVTSGGFAGTLTAGTLSNCYAGGHTQNGVYLPSVPNVTGTGSAGGFAGTWTGGTLGGLCYTTCAVSGNNQTDVFAVATGMSVPAGCYAGGDVFMGGTTVATAEHNSAKATTGTLPTGAGQAAYPYDSTLPAKYPYKPVTDAAGAPMAHYGDWPRKLPTTSSKYEWMPKPEEFSKPNMQNISAKANWNGNTLELEFETFGWTTLENWFTTSGGYMAITTDLGYVLPMKVVSEYDYSVYPATITTKLMDANGNVWATEVQTKNGDESTGWQPTRTYKFAISSEVLPPYLETINVGEFKFAPMITDIKNSDPDGCTNKPTEEFPPRGKTVEIDGKYDDWTGYPSQLLAYTPGNSSIAGISYGSAFGRHSTIFVHARNAYTKVEMPFEGKKLQDMPMFKNLPTSVRGDDNWSEHLSGWHEHFSNLDYTGPGIYKWEELRPDPETGEMVPTVLVQAYIDVQEDGSQEVEMAFYLDRIAGADVADKIDHFQIGFDFGGSLTVERNLDEKDAWADD